MDSAQLHTRETHSVSFSATRSQSTPSTYEEEYSEDDSSVGDSAEESDLDPIQDDTNEGDSEEGSDLDPVEEMNRIVAQTRLKHGF